MRFLDASAHANGLLNRFAPFRQEHESSLSDRVGAEDAPSVLQGPLVLPAVLSIQLAPVPGGVAGHVAERILFRLLQQL